MVAQPRGPNHSPGRLDVSPGLADELAHVLLGDLQSHDRAAPSGSRLDADRRRFGHDALGDEFRQISVVSHSADVSSPAVSVASEAVSVVAGPAAAGTPPRGPSWIPPGLVTPPL